jgi:hypothetical protein
VNLDFHDELHLVFWFCAPAGTATTAGPARALFLVKPELAIGVPTGVL